MIDYKTETVSFVDILAFPCRRSNFHKFYHQWLYNPAMWVCSDMSENCGMDGTPTNKLSHLSNSCKCVRMLCLLRSLKSSSLNT